VRVGRLLGVFAVLIIMTSAGPPDGVLMNGNGYCLEAVPGAPLYIDFAAQCAGTPSQLWHYHSSHLASSVTATSAAAGTCATIAGPVVPGAELVGTTCPRPGVAQRRTDGAPAPSRSRPSARPLSRSRPSARPPADPRTQPLPPVS
jgi:hypothetical protein